MAAIDIPVFITDLKDHAIDHGFHVHDERHYVESYSLGQVWEVELHPEEACGGPLNLYLSLEVDPRTFLGFEDAVTTLANLEEPPDLWFLPLSFKWTLPPLANSPDLLVLATELAAIGRLELPLEVTTIESTASVTDAAVRTLNVISKIDVSLAKIFTGQEQLCDVLDRCLETSRFLLQRSPSWLEQ